MSTSLTSGEDNNNNDNYVNSSNNNNVNNNNNTDQRRFTPLPIRRIMFRDNDSIANMTPLVNNTTTATTTATTTNTANHRRRHHHPTLHTSNIPNTLQHEIVWPSEPSCFVESTDSNRKMPWMPSLVMQEAKVVACWTILTLVLHGTVLCIVPFSHDNDDPPSPSPVPLVTSVWHTLSHILRSTRSLVARLTVGLLSLLLRLDQIHPCTPGLLFAPANLLLALPTWTNATFAGTRKRGILPNLTLRLCEWRMGRVGKRAFWMILVVHAFVPYLLSGLLSCLVWLTMSLVSVSSSESDGLSSSSSSSSWSWTLVSLVLSGMSSTNNSGSGSGSSSGSGSGSSSSNAGAAGTTERLLASAAASALDAAASQTTMENQRTLLVASIHQTATLINNTSQCADAAATAADCLSNRTSTMIPNLMAAAVPASTASTTMASSEANVSWMLLATLVTRHVLITTVFTTGLLVVPVLLKVNALPEWLTFILLLPLYSIAVTRSGQGSTLNATATLWLLLTRTTTVAASTMASVSISTLLWQHLVPQLLGGWLAGRIMKVYFPDDPQA